MEHPASHFGTQIKPLIRQTSRPADYLRNLRHLQNSLGQLDSQRHPEASLGA